MKKHYLVVTAFAATAVLSGCGSDNTNQEDSTGTIQIGYNLYAEAIAFSHVWEQLLEEQGYDVELASVEKAFLFSGVEQGDYDIGFNTWLPLTDRAYIDENSDTIDVQEDGVLYEGATLGLAVPTYMEDVQSIADLPDAYDDLNGTIYGIDPGSALMGITEDEVIPHYGLEDFSLSASSEQAMVAELQNAYQNEDPIVVTLWSPHWTLGEYDLKFLDDPDRIYGEPDDIYYLARKGLEEDHSDVITWLNNAQFTDETLGELLQLQAELDDDEEAAKQWIEQNRELVDSWLEK
ncbi:MULTISPECIES: glycine betaine ABC transporter substrate-binding protein [Shouchella]|uniref:ABC-type glycine betaine transport system, substrate-binding protein n=2 Tax=Bacillaceae TaxID=186817 RepID=A0A060LR21_9BACI|nr:MULTISPECIES: glycine betaine ABC transporter substrate-binding protein [Bacillaceae]AIC93731.1 ABC-type glycine betaine transport system, substrate-binding protein [Shouchella lehensis G1]KQL59137.1 glycine/betaine ABC transporter [Alkalicoccobacillus plakortidis]RQW21960.1 glycine betaine ABC transporter substrate-binding protein [Bacillus sp. C1-1]